MMTFIIYVLILAALLFYPMSKLIWVLSVRRLQKKTNQELNEQELAGQMSRARFISLFVCLSFSFLYNLNTIGLPN